MNVIRLLEVNIIVNIYLVYLKYLLHVIDIFNNIPILLELIN